MKNYLLHAVHEFAPVYFPDSCVLILGSFPSVKSRAQKFYYGHPQNRFWKVIASVCHDGLPDGIEEKKLFLKRNRIALWDVLEECDITGSSDSSIRNPVPTELMRILTASPIVQIYTNGRTAGNFYEKYQQPVTGRPAIVLPSTSPANAAWSLERLISVWNQISEVTNNE